VRPPTGGTFNLTGFPVGLEFDRTQIGADRGEAKSYSILGLVAWGNSSPTSAARNGRLVVIDHLDAEFFNVLGIYSYYKTVAFGRTGPENIVAVAGADTAIGELPPDARRSGAP
jgi:hypothetical protein